MKNSGIKIANLTQESLDYLIRDLQRSQQKNRELKEDRNTWQINFTREQERADKLRMELHNAKAEIKELKGTISIIKNLKIVKKKKQICLHNWVEINSGYAQMCTICNMID